MDQILENLDSIIIVVYCFIIGIVIAFALSLITKGVYGRFVDALVKNGADSPDTARTLNEIKIKNNRLLSHSLSHRITLSSLVSCTNGDAEENDRRYYIAPQHRIKAQALYGIERLSIASLVIAIVLFAVILLLFNYVVPKFIA